jgi:hypothetical protein
MRKYLPIAILTGCAALFAFGLVELFALRFATGDVYPAYSSLRADPMGTMALYESLETIPGLTVRRDFSDSDKLPAEPHTVYLQFAGSPDDWHWLSPESFHDLEDFLARGDRLVIAFSSQAGWPTFNNNSENDDPDAHKPDKTKSGKMTPGKKKKPPADESTDVSLPREWGFKVDFDGLTQNGDTYAPATVVNATDLPLPEKLDWHSGMVFNHWDKSWRVIYGRGHNAVLMERNFAHGSVVLATDSYFASNEAMEKDRHADLLAWLIGTNSQVVFDESHLGIVDTGGVAKLMRQYRLHGLMAGFILLAGLFIWKNSSSLAPPLTDESREPFIAGKDSAAGFANLLRRNLAPRDLLAVCFAEWKKSGAAGKFSKDRLQQAEAVFNSENSAAAKDRNPVGSYIKISRILGNQRQKL